MCRHLSCQNQDTRFVSQFWSSLHQALDTKLNSSYSSAERRAVRTRNPDPRVGSAYSVEGALCMHSDTKKVPEYRF